MARSGTRTRGGRRRAPCAAATLVATALAAASVSAEGVSQGASAREPGAAPRLVLGSGAEGVAYVDEAGCRRCHAEQAAGWRPSQHARAMQPASDETVLGDFGGVVHEQDGETFRFFRRDGSFFVNAAGANGARRDHRVLYTFGVEPLQQYLVPGERGRLQALGVAWDTVRGRWFDLDPEQSPGPGDAFHWTGRYQAWNAMCADCHSTDLRKGYDPDTDAYATTWSAVNVGCQACHGPGARHVAWAEQAARRQAVSEGRASGIVPRYAMTTAHDEVETCAPCHSRRASITGDAPLHGTLLDDYLPQTLEPGLYHADGQILGEVYVYGSFLQSRMYAAGVRCSDCHEPHGLGLRAEGNALCTRCHGDAPERDLPGLRPGSYDSPDHHHHAPGSAGAECVACHMPEQTYMVVDPRRDHSMRVPRPDLSTLLGVPNACSGCHADRGAGWAAARVREWHGAERERGAAWGAAIHDGRHGDPSALDRLASLARPGAAPGIVRATAVSLLPFLGAGAQGPLVAATGDEDPLVRVQAVSALSVLPPQQRLPLLLPLLDDPVRAVRAEAGRALADVPEVALSPEQQQRLAAAVAEYEAGQRASADLPPGRINLALLYTALGRTGDAEREYRAAIAQDPRFAPPVANLAQLLSALGRRDDAEEVLREGVARMPEEGELHYSLGLLLAEAGSLDASVAALERAAQLLPDRARVHYNLGLALQHLGRRERATEALERAARLDPTQSDFARALAIVYLQVQRWAEARDEARRWLALAPHDRAARSVLARAESALAGEGPGAR